MTTLIFIYNVRIKKAILETLVQICYLQIAISLRSTPDVILERKPRILQMCSPFILWLFGIEIRPPLLRAQGTQRSLGSGNPGAAIVVSYVLIGRIWNSSHFFLNGNETQAGQVQLPKSFTAQVTNPQMHQLIITQRATSILGWAFPPNFHRLSLLAFQQFNSIFDALCSWVVNSGCPHQNLSVVL